jgi:ABC-type multidrug transport system ATPase subunit
VLGLTDYMKRKPGQLSGGQRQRVALARAIVRDPAVFLMDEPLSNLDAKLRGDTRAELVDLHRRLDSTFIYVTHDQVEAMTMGSRVAVLNAGRLEQVGTPQEVYDHPAIRLRRPVHRDAPDEPLARRHARQLRGAGGHSPRAPVAHRWRPAAGTCRQVEHLGHEVLLLTESAGGTRLDGPSGPARSTFPSSVLPLPSTPPHHLHRFDATTGVRVS